MSDSRYKLNKELAQMLKSGVIMDVTTPEQARIAEEAGAFAEHEQMLERLGVPYIELRKKRRFITEI